jgi:hypothetical protein
LYTTRISTHGNRLRQPASTDQEPRYERPSDAGVLPEDLFNSRSSRATMYPEAALMCAVLEDALDCFQKQFISGTKRAERLGHEAEEWLFSDDSDWVFSFVSICTALDLGPEYIRWGLKGWRGRRQDRSQKKRPHVVRVPHRLVA